MFWKKDYHYLAFYTYVDSKGDFGVGNIDCTIHGNKYPSIDEIRELEKQITEKLGFRRVVCTGFERIRVVKKPKEKEKQDVYQIRRLRSEL